MVKKDSIDELLHQYGKSAFEKKYNDDIEDYIIKIEEDNIKMPLSFDEFWSSFNNKNIIKKKRRKNIVLAIVASLILAFVAIGPSNVVTFAKEVIHKLVIILDDRIQISYDGDGTMGEYEVIKPKYIPQSYTIDEEYKDEYGYTIYYTNGNVKENICFDTYPLENNTLIFDTEGSKEYTVIIKGIKANVIENEIDNVIYLEKGKQGIDIVGNVEVGELIKMMESVLEQMED